MKIPLIVPELGFVITTFFEKLEFKELVEPDDWLESDWSLLLESYMTWPNGSSFVGIIFFLIRFSFLRLSSVFWWIRATLNDVILSIESFGNYWFNNELIF